MHDIFDIFLCILVVQRITKLTVRIIFGSARKKKKMCVIDDTHLVPDSPIFILKKMNGLLALVLFDWKVGIAEDFPNEKHLYTDYFCPPSLMGFNHLALRF